MSVFGGLRGYKFIGREDVSNVSVTSGNWIVNVINAEERFAFDAVESRRTDWLLRTYQLMCKEKCYNKDGERK